MAHTIKIHATPTRILRVGTGSKMVAAPAVVDRAKSLDSLIASAVFFSHDGERLAGRVKRIDGDQVVINLAVPSRDGLLYVSDTELSVKASEVEVTKAMMQQKRVAAFETGINLKLSEDSKFSTVYDDTAEGATKTVCDYLDVAIEGYASTWGSATNKDRGGDYIAPNAFDATIRQFLTNPVILRNHKNDTESLAGSWTKVGVTPDGLAVRGAISNAPGLRDTRFKLVEGHLKGLSIGGIWYYSQVDSGLIEEAELFEISLVAVPMNPEALAQTRSLGVAECRKAFRQFWRKHSSLRSE
jgi:HK97 family phage prohead protease